MAIIIKPFSNRYNKRYFSISEKDNDQDKKMALQHCFFFFAALLINSIIHPCCNYAMTSV